MKRNCGRSNLRSPATVFGAMTLALGACASGASEAVETRPAEASSTTVVVDPDDWDATSCVWRWFDRWDITVVVPEGVAVGTSVALRASLFQDDVSSVGAVGSLDITGPGPLVAQMHVPPLEWLDPTSIEVSRGGALSPPEGSMCEVDLVTEQGATLGTPTLSYDVDPPSADGTPLGDLVAAVDSTDSPMFALAGLLWLQPKSTFDRLYLATDATLDSITVEREGTCRSINSQYTDVRVTQQHGCAEPLPSEAAPGWSSLAVPDDNWAVTVNGPTADVTALIAVLQSIDVPEGEPAAGPAVPGNDEWLDGYFAAHPEITELARFSWRDGKIAIVGRSVPGSPVDYLEPVVYGVNANYGSTGVPCKAYTIGISSSANGAGAGATVGGYAWFVTDEPGTTFTLTAPGLSTTIALQQSTSGEYVGFLDLDLVALQHDQIAISDSTGNPVPCIQ